MEPRWWWYNGLSWLIRTAMEAPHVVCWGCA